MSRAHFIIPLALATLPLANGCSESSGQVVNTPIALVDFSGRHLLGLVASGRDVIFTVDLPDTGRELWVSDGTPEGTRLVVDLNPGPAQGAVGVLNSLGAQDVTVNGEVFFFATDGQTGFELWRTDGTETGTELVLDANPGPGDGEYRDLVVAQNRIYFTTYDLGTDLTTLWVLNVPPQSTPSLPF